MVLLCFSVLPNADLLLTTTSGVEKLVLLVEVEVTNTKTSSKESSCNLLGKISAIPNSIFTFSLLVTARGDEEVFINPCEFACLWTCVSNCLHDAALHSRIEVQHHTLLANNTEGLTIGVPSHASGKIGEVVKHHGGLLIFDIPNSYSKICRVSSKSIVRDSVPSQS